MNKFNKILLALLFSVALIGCSDDDEATPDRPSASVDSPVKEVKPGSDAVFTLDISAPGTVKSVTASAGTVDQTAVVGKTSGTATVTYSSDTEGEQLIEVTITDNNDKVDNRSMLVKVLEDAVEVIIVDANITTDETWVSGNIYRLAGRIAVEDGATLTIEAGTIIKGEAGTGANSTALIVARGGKLMAEGTANSPIIFTSVADEILPGQIASPNLDPDINGLWGGLIVLGKAPISSAKGVEQQIEGIPGDDSNGLYGGTEAADNSGVIKYISVRHGGTNIGEGNEINGITLGGVGSGTTIEYVEVIGNQDDGIEWFGGTVDVKNAVIWNAGDDAVDTDQDWIGMLYNFAIVAGSDTDHAFELDGPEGTQRTALGHTIRKGSVKGYIATDNGNIVAGGAELGNWRAMVELTMDSIYFFNFTDPVLSDGRGDFSFSDGSEQNYVDGSILLSNLETVLPTGITLDQVFKSGTDQDATAVTTPDKSGVDKSVFAGWSWTFIAGELNDF
ncbi:hypothetical protein R9C00_04540 [Flammeovirgaceae bacterium SG7u.111]|nr:hypothetical protein [Flammeovirgaceae bacterium SG7u.132]WPO36715.1 hypothetical protein R9C00_04540 [Flammeovirgaceae bacterium SG7u.111]